MIINKISILIKLLFFIIALSVVPAHAKNKTNLLYDGFTVSYDVYKDDFYLGVSERQLIKKSSNDYVYKSLTYAKGVAGWFVKDKVTEQTQYQLLNSKIIPSRYDYKNSNGKAKDNFSFIFNNAKNTVTRTKDNIEHKIAQNKQDLLSFQVAIMLAMQSKSKNIKFTIVDNKRIAEYSLKQTRTESLETEGGEIKTQVMESNNNNRYRFIFWCAKKYDYFPIKIKRIKNNNSELLMKINSINGEKINFIEPDEDEEYEEAY